MKVNIKTQPVLLISLIYILFLMPVLLMAETKDSIVISGVMQDTINASDGTVFEVSVVQKNAVYTWIGYQEIYKGILRHGHFQVVVPAKDDLFYVTFNIEYPNRKREFLNENTGGSAPYILEKGDRILLNISTGKRVVFSGKGAEKLKCQQKIFQLKYMPDGAGIRHNELFNAHRFEEDFKTNEQFLKLNMEMKLAILDSYKNDLTEPVYNLIRMDCIGRQLDGLYGYFSSFTRRNYLAKVRPLSEYYIQKYIQQEIPVDTSLREAVLSAYYPSSLLVKEKAKLLFYPKHDLNEPLDYKDLYNSIKDNYHGDLRDKLYLISILEFAGRYEKVYNYLDVMLEQMNDNDSKRMLQQWKIKNELGSKAYPFELPDEKGKIYTLNDFRGKIIVADFWFTGCFACPYMAKILTPIALHYKDNPDVVFLSINVDKYKSIWEKGLKDGIYTFPGAIHLSTFGETRSAHPLLKFYNYQGCPQLLIIDGKGNIISTNPPDPRKDKGVKLIELLNKSL